jgi:GNAT superfamily N-acetyltransferase
MQVVIAPAGPDDIPVVSGILHEAAAWLEARGIPLWRQDEIAEAPIAADVMAGLYVLARVAGDPAATVRVQHSDPDFWPEVPDGDSLFVHRLAVRRAYAGGAMSTALLAWAADHATGLGRRHLRLDCEASRPKLRAIYERFGFRYHSDRQVGPYLVARYELPLPHVRPA